MLRFVQHFQCACPLLAPHIDHAKVRVRARNLRIDCQNGSKSTASVIQVAALKRSLTLLKKLGGIGISGRRCGWRFLRFSWLQCLRSVSLTASK